LLVSCRHRLIALVLNFIAALTLAGTAQAGPRNASPQEINKDRDQNLRILDARLTKAAFPARVVKTALMRAAWAAKGHPYVSDSFSSSVSVRFVRTGGSVDYRKQHGRPVLYLEVGRRRPDALQGSVGLFLMHTYTKISKNQTVEDFEVQRSMSSPVVHKYFVLDAAGKRVPLSAAQAAALLAPKSKRTRASTPATPRQSAPVVVGGEMLDASGADAYWFR
jgi:hypothetical protein